MNPVNLLLRQTASGVNLEGSRGLPEITTELISLACINLSKKYYLAARVKWCGEAESLRAVSDLVEQDIKKIAKQDHWQVKPGHLKKLCWLACLELYAPKMRISGIAQAQYIGVKKDIYYRRYKHYINQIYSHLEDYTNIAFTHIKKHCR